MNNKYDTKELKEKMLKSQIESLVNTIEIMDNELDIESIKKIQKKIEDLNNELKNIKPNDEKITIKKELSQKEMIDNQIDSLTYAMEIMENILDIKVILQIQKKSEELELKKSNLSRKVI